MPGRGRGRGRGRGSGQSAGRGRGRSAGRGRGRSGGRRGRGMSRGGYQNTGSRDHDDSKDKVVKDLDVNKDVTSYFVGSVSADQHFEGQNQNRDRYAAGMAVLEKNGVEIALNARVRALAAAWARHDYDLADAFLKNKDNFGLNEVLKALSLLDSGRQVRVLEKKVKRLQTSGGKVKPHTMGKLKSDIDNLNKNKPTNGSASGAVCKHVQRWVKRFTKKELEFYALHFPKEPWKKLADICHFNPKKDFAALEWFIDFCYGAPAPEGTLAQRCRDVTEENVNGLLKEFNIPYAHIKPHISNTAILTTESKARIASYETKLDTVLWYYEELRCTEADQVIQDRINSGETITLPNGKLLERLLVIKMYMENRRPIDWKFNCEGWDCEGWDCPSCKKTQESTTDEIKAPFFKQLLPLAQTKIDGISLSLEAPIVVIGDASGSMEVAIKTSSIIAGLLTAITSAQLCFFNDENRYAPYLPKNVEEVLQLAVDTEAGGGTTPAASLWPFYEKKEVVKTFIIVTDEEENGDYNDYEFHELFKKYHDEVYPAKLVFVSFFYHQQSRGYMVPKLEELGFKPLRFVFDLNRPDLTKLDKLFGMLATGTSSFNDEIAEMEHIIKTNGIAKAFENVSF